MILILNIIFSFLLILALVYSIKWVMVKNGEEPKIVLITSISAILAFIIGNCSEKSSNTPSNQTNIDQNSNSPLAGTIENQTNNYIFVDTTGFSTRRPSTQENNLQLKKHLTADSNFDFNESDFDSCNPNNPNRTNIGVLIRDYSNLKVQNEIFDLIESSILSSNKNAEICKVSNTIDLINYSNLNKINLYPFFDILLIADLNVTLLGTSTENYDYKFFESKFVLTKYFYKKNIIEKPAPLIKKVKTQSYLNNDFGDVIVDSINFFLTKHPSLI